MYSQVCVLTLETTAQRESLSLLEHLPYFPVAYTRGKEDKSTLRVLSAFGPFSANPHCSNQTCTVVVFKHDFLLSQVFPDVKCLPLSFGHSEIPFVGTGSPLLCPHPFCDLGQSIAKMKCKVKTWNFACGLGP